MSAQSAPLNETGPKARTRRLLAEAAHELLRTGAPLTVAAAAELAGVSRATAYRYFPSNDAVILHATLPLTQDPPPDLTADHEPETSPAALPQRAADLVRERGIWAFEHETELRTLLRLSLAPERAGNTPRRGNTNRSEWIASLLQALPDHVLPTQRRRLAAALTPLFGADAVVWTTDIAKLDREEALDTLAWTAYTLVHAVITEH